MKVDVDAADQKGAEEKVRRENPTCAITKVETRQADARAGARRASVAGPAARSAVGQLGGLAWTPKWAPRRR